MLMNPKAAATEFARNAKDTGSPEFQIALFSHRIKDITGHLQTNKKDHQGRRGLLALVVKRKRLLKYLSRTNHGRYQEVVQKLEKSKIKV
jgi:small subunit ribosomal protein S15|tara:strand:+ start:471 stop:740 length:270 start_codon:yes stop_codon:yes gene_type:complete